MRGGILRKVISEKKAIIFDLFHTLASVEYAWSNIPRTTNSSILGISQEKWNEQLLEKSVDRLRGKVKDPLTIVRQMAHAIDPQIPLDLVEKATENRIEMFHRTMLRIPDSTIKTLQKLKDDGKKLGLLSNADVSEVASWNESPISCFFDSTVFSCEVGFVKPERQTYEISLQRLSLSPEDVVFVGDGGSHELEGAKEMGISTVFIAGWIRELWPEKIEARKKLADYSIESIEELIS